MTHQVGGSTSSKEGPTSRFIPIGAVRLRVADWGGQGPPLVLLHGGRRTGRSWDAVARRLRDSFRVLALDARGHGDSDAPPSGYADQDRVSDLAGVIGGLGLGPLFLMGHSLGGATGALYAARHAEKVRGAILIEPVPDGPRHWVRVGAFNEDRTPRDRARRNGWASLGELRQVLQRNPMTQAWTPEVLEDVLQGETRVHADGRVEMKWHAYAYNPEELRKDTFSLLAEAPRLTMPVLIMASAGNAHLQSDLGPIAHALPRGILVALPGLGHNIYMEAPDMVADYARRFFLESDMRLLRPD